MVTLKTIAQEARTSITTVSRVLNATNDSEIKASPETIQRIREIAKRSHYMPNQMARAMKTKSSKCIGIVTPLLTDPYFCELSDEIRKYLWEKGYNSILFPYDTDNLENYIEEERNLLERLNYWHLDGLIFTYPDMHGQISKIDKLYGGNKAIVVMDYDYSESGLNMVYINLSSSVERALRYLMSTGMEDIVFVGHKYNQQDPRLKTFIKVFEDKGRTIQDDMFIDCRYDIADGYKAAEQLISVGRIPQAILAVNDNVALGAMQYFLNRGYKIPDQVSIVGVNDIHNAKYAYPPLTTIRQPLRKIAEALANMALSSLAEKSDVRSVVEVETELIIRGSTK